MHPLVSAKSLVFMFRGGTPNLSPKLMGCLTEQKNNKIRGKNLGALCSNHIKQCTFLSRVFTYI
jgi:hypothetical protein